MIKNKIILSLSTIFLLTTNSFAFLTTLNPIENKHKYIKIEKDNKISECEIKPDIENKEYYDFYTFEKKKTKVEDNIFIKDIVENITDIEFDNKEQNIFRYIKNKQKFCFKGLQHHKYGYKLEYNFEYDLNKPHTKKEKKEHELHLEFDLKHYKYDKDNDIEEYCIEEEILDNCNEIPKTKYTETDNNFITYITSYVTDSISNKLANNNIDIWIDFNHNNIIDTNEYGNFTNKEIYENKLNIKKIFINKNLELTSSELSELFRFPNIKDLTINNNNIPDIELNNSNIEKLNLDNNFIETLNVSDNNKLEYLTAKNNIINNITIYSNNLKYINLSQNNISDLSKLNESNLEEIYLSNNNISDITPLKNNNNFKNFEIDKENIKRRIELKDNFCKNDKYFDLNNIDSLKPYCNINNFLNFVSKNSNYIWIDENNDDNITENEVKDKSDYYTLSDNIDKIKKIKIEETAKTEDLIDSQKVINLKELEITTDSENFPELTNKIEKIIYTEKGNTIDYSNLSDLTNLNTLVFNGIEQTKNSIIDLNSLDDLTKLKDLEFYNFNTYDKTLLNLNNLENLEILIIDNSLKSSEENFKWLSNNIKYLIIDYKNKELNNYKTTEGLEILSNLEYLTLNNIETEIDNIPSNVKYLEISNNTKITEIPKLPNLHSLTLNNVDNFENIKNIEENDFTNSFEILGNKYIPQMDFDNKQITFKAELSKSFCQSQAVNKNPNICENEIPYLNEIDRLNILTWIDFNKNDIKDNEEISSEYTYNELLDNKLKIKGIYGINKEVSTIENIEYLMNLYELEINYNKDLTDISNLINLTNLHIKTNETDLSSFKKIDKLNLIVLDNPKSIKDLEDLKNTTTIIINDTDEVLNVNKIENLKKIQTNEITNVSENNNIEYIDLETINNNELEKLNNLKVFKVNNVVGITKTPNSISEVDLTNSNIDDLSIFNDNTNINKIYFNKNLKYKTLLSYKSDLCKNKLTVEDKKQYCDLYENDFIKSLDNESTIWVDINNNEVIEDNELNLDKTIINENIEKVKMVKTNNEINKEQSKDLTELKNLKYLEIKPSDKEVYYDIFNNSNLVELIIDNKVNENEFVDLEEVSDLSNLKMLKLININNSVNAEKGISYSTNLEVLSLGNSSIELSKIKNNNIKVLETETINIEDYNYIPNLTILKFKDNINNNFKGIENFNNINNIIYDNTQELNLNLSQFSQYDNLSNNTEETYNSVLDIINIKPNKNKDKYFPFDKLSNNINKISINSPFCKSLTAKSLLLSTYIDEDGNTVNKTNEEKEETNKEYNNVCIDEILTNLESLKNQDIFVKYNTNYVEYLKKDTSDTFLFKIDSIDLYEMYGLIGERNSKANERTLKDYIKNSYGSAIITKIEFPEEDTKNNSLKITVKKVSEEEDTININVIDKNGYKTTINKIILLSDNPIKDLTGYYNLDDKELSSNNNTEENSLNLNPETNIYISLYIQQDNENKKFNYINYYDLNNKVNIVSNNDCIKASTNNNEYKTIDGNTIQLEKTCDTEETTLVEIRLNNLNPMLDEENGGDSLITERTLSFYISPTKEPIQLSSYSKGGLMLTFPISQENELLIKNLKRKDITFTDLNKMYQLLKDIKYNKELEGENFNSLNEVLDSLTNEELEDLQEELK